MYSDYTTYQQRGGNLPHAQYLQAAQRAAELIDYVTWNRAAQCPEMEQQLSACECELIPYLLQSGQEELLASASTDGYSCSWVSRAEQEAAKTAILRRYLTFPVDLMHFAGKEGR